MRKTEKKTILWIVKIFLFWRVSLFFFAYLGIKFLPFKHSFPYAEQILHPYKEPLFWSWANFDGVHYLGIVQKGYFAQFTQAFFPFYPLLVRFLNFFFRNFLLTGLLINHLAFLGALYFLYKLLKIDFDEKKVKKTISFLLFFPTSFFFASFYTESLFLFLSLGSFYFARKRLWWLSGFLGFLASLTRLIGVLLFLVILWEIYQTGKKKSFFARKKIKNWPFAFLPIVGLAIYMAYLGKSFSDPLYFLHAQPAFGASRNSEKIILLYQVFFRYLKMLFTFNLQPFFYFTLNLEFFSSLLFLLLLFFSFKKKIRMSYNIFAALAYILPTLTGTFSSMPRYVLVLFPCFAVLGLIKSKFWRRLLLVSFYLLLLICTALFTRGYWIA